MKKIALLGLSLLFTLGSLAQETKTTKEAKKATTEKVEKNKKEADKKKKETEKKATEVKKETGELIPLVPNNNNTVQPVALMRLGLFVPTLKSTSKGRKGLMVTTNATEELKQLSLVTSEGFDNIQITGARLDMDNDFKTWVCRAFTKYQINRI